MWELGVMIAALPSRGQSQQGSAGQDSTRTVLPVFLMDLEAVTATYEQHWTPAAIEAARAEGLPPAALSDLQRLLGYQGIRQDQVLLPRLCSFLVLAGVVLISQYACDRC